MKARFRRSFIVAVFTVGCVLTLGGRGSFAADPAGKRKMSFHRLHLSPTVDLPAHAKFDAFIETSEEEKTTYHILIQGQGRSLAGGVHMQLSYDGKVVLDGKVAGIVGAGEVALIEVKLNAPVRTERTTEQIMQDEAEGKKWSPPVITKFKALFK